MKSMDVRQANVEDISELVRLREVLAARMAADRAIGEGWQEAYARSLKERLGGSDLAIFVIDRPDGEGLAACVIGFIDEHFPGPTVPDGRFGYIQGMATDPAFRRRGYAKAVMGALLDWYRAKGVRRIDLHATSDGEPIYRGFGFTSHSLGLSWNDASQ
jgi:GNAT superfamily N-acetyltransferase